MKTRTRLFSSRPIVAVALLAVAALGGQLSAESVPAATRNFTLDGQPPSREGALGGYSAIVDEVSPSVVSVLSNRRVRPPAGWERFFFFDPHSGRFQQMPEPADPPSGETRPHGLGSGVIVTEDGYIVTNRHVIDGADEVKVALGKPTRIYDAEIVGTDEETDVAVLKIDANGLQAIALGDSRVLKTGDIVLAIGSPFGLQQTVTTGIVSALNRTELGLTGQSGYENFIQTDASINPGNSGGALVDNRGRLVGINTAIFSRNGGNVGIGFAIPSDLAIDVTGQLIDYGEVRRGFLGVALGDLSADLATAMKTEQAGALVHDVVRGSPADKTGIRPGDVIVGYRDSEVPGSAQLRLMVGSTRPGTKAGFKIIRDGKDLVLHGVVGSRDGQSKRPMKTATPRSAPSHPDEELLDGVWIADLGADLRSRPDVPHGIQGVLVEHVAAGSAAAAAGLRRGDIITEVARTPVRSVNEALEAREQASTAGNNAVLLLRVLNEDGLRFVAVETS